MFSKLVAIALKILLQLNSELGNTQITAIPLTELIMLPTDKQDGLKYMVSFSFLTVYN